MKKKRNKYLKMLIDISSFPKKNPLKSMTNLSNNGGSIVFSGVVISVLASDYRYICVVGKGVGFSIFCV